MPRNRRRKLFIEPKIQGALLFRVASYWIAMIWAAAVLLVGAPYAIGVALSQHPPEFLDVLSRVFAQMWPALFVATMMLPLVLLDVLRQSHKIVGPTLRIRRALTELADGKTIDPIYLRKGDYWAEPAEAINRIQENLLAAAVPCPIRRQGIDSASLGADTSRLSADGSRPNVSATLVLPAPRRAQNAPDDFALDELNPEGEDRETIVLTELRSLRLEQSSARLEQSSPQLEQGSSQPEKVSSSLGETTVFSDRLDVGDLTVGDLADEAEEVASTVPFGRETTEFRADDRDDD